MTRFLLITPEKLAVYEGNKLLALGDAAPITAEDAEAMRTEDYSGNEEKEETQ